MRHPYTLWVIVLSLSSFLVAAQPAEKSQRTRPKRPHRQLNTHVLLQADPQVLAVPLTWKEVSFRYEQLPPAREYPASLLIGVVLSYDLDTIRVTSDSTTLRFGNPQLCEFFRRFKPSSLERRLTRSPLDTTRSPFDNDRSDTERRIRRRIERANRYRLYFADTSRQAAIDVLSAIPGVISVRRPADAEIFQDQEF